MSNIMLTNILESLFVEKLQMEKKLFGKDFHDGFKIKSNEQMSRSQTLGCDKKPIQFQDV